MWRLAAITAAFCLFEGLTSPHDLSRLLFAFPYVLLLFVCRKWVTRPLPRSTSQSLRLWACVGAAVILLHPFTVPHLLWTHTLTYVLNFLMVGAIFYLRYREQRATATQ